MSRANGRTEERERERGKYPFGNVEGNVNQLERYFQTIRLIVKPLDVDDDDVRGYFNGIKENYLGIVFDFDDKSQRGRQFLRA